MTLVSLGASPLILAGTGWVMQGFGAAPLFWASAACLLAATGVVGVVLVASREHLP